MTEPVYEPCPIKRKRRTKKEMAELKDGLREVRFRFDFEGTKVVIQ